MSSLFEKAFFEHYVQTRTLNSFPVGCWYRILKVEKFESKTKGRSFFKLILEAEESTKICCWVPEIYSHIFTEEYISKVIENPHYLNVKERRQTQNIFDIIPGKWNFILHKSDNLFQLLSLMIVDF